MKQIAMAHGGKLAVQIIRGILITAGCFCLYLRWDFRDTVKNTAPIDYRLVNQTQTFWRGSRYAINVLYNGRFHEVSVSRATSDSIDAGHKPLLYYNKLTSSIIYDYHVSLAIRVMVVVVVLLLLSLMWRGRAAIRGHLRLGN